MVHSRQESKAAQDRQTIDLFDPHRAMRQSQIPSAIPSSTQFVTSQSIAGNSGQSWRQSSTNLPMAASVSRNTGISSFNPSVQQKHDPIQVNHHLQQGAQPKKTNRSSMRGENAATFVRSIRKSGRRRAANRGVRSPDFKYLLAGGSLLAGFVLVGDISSVFEAEPVANVCQEIVQPDAVLSRDSLSRLISIPERDAKSSVREILNEPYCVLPSIEIRSGELAEREAYPLAFDPQTWVVLLYEGDEYAGYDFSFQP